MNKLPKDVQRIIGRYLHRDKIDKLLHPELVIVTRDVYQALYLNHAVITYVYCKYYKCSECLHWSFRWTEKKLKKGKSPVCSRCFLNTLRNIIR
jgi:hypothetical protein